MQTLAPRTLALLAALLLPSALPANAIPIPPGLNRCPTLAACFALLDKTVPAEDDGSMANEKTLARDLRRFGEPAKQELLRRAAGNHPGWRNLAGAILMEWHSWSPADVPALRAALQKQHGGWVAHPLAEIGTPEAIAFLVEDLAQCEDIENQTGWALTQLGARPIPYLFALLANDRSARLAASVLSEIGAAAVPFLPKWAETATDPGQPTSTRIAALRGIAALGPTAEPDCSVLHPLLNDHDPNLRGQAKETLRAVRDPAVLPELAQSCRPMAPLYESLAIDALACLRDIASYGKNAAQAGPLLLPFLASQNGAERADGIAVLGASGYEPAIPKIQGALNDPDWRVVYSAIRALGWLGASGALPELDRLATSHWLPEIREKAAHAALAIRSEKSHVDPPPGTKFIAPPFGREDGDEPLDVDRWVLHPAKNCPANRWQWQGDQFPMPNPTRFMQESENQPSSLRLSGGELTGVNKGEWGGEFSWHPDAGQPVTILKDTFIAMRPDGDGAIVLFGLDHGLDYGYALSVTRDGAGSWKTQEIARLLGEPDGLATIRPGLFAARSAGRVVVFSSAQGIQGLATCDSR
jgi:HEAT repeat protein